MIHSTSITPLHMNALSRRSNAAGCLQLTGHMVIIIFTGWWLVSLEGGAWSPIALILHGIGLVFLFSGEHEAIHFTAFRSRSMNWIVATLIGQILLLPPIWFRYFHLAHHRWTQDPGRDPELGRPKPQTAAHYCVWVSGIHYWNDRLNSTIRHALGKVDDAFVPAQSRLAVVREARLMLLGYISLTIAAINLNFWQEALMLWILPIVVGQPFLRLYLLAEHMGCDHVPDMLRNTRTTLTNPLVRFLAWNMPYHVEHHTYPGIPFHALPKLHQMLKPRIHYLSNGYISVHSKILKRLFARS